MKLNPKKIKGLVIFFGGANDASNKNMKRVYDAYQNDYNHEKYYLSWEDGKAAKIRIVSQLVNVSLETPVCLIGHSYGGDTAMDVATDLSSVDLDVQLLVTLDPVSKEGPHQAKLPEHVPKWLNVWVDTGIKGWADLQKLDNLTAEVGGHWGQQTNAEDIPLGTEFTHLQADKMFEKVKVEVLFFEIYKQVDLKLRQENRKLYETYLNKLMY